MAHHKIRWPVARSEYLVESVEPYNRIVTLPLSQTFVTAIASSGIDPSWSRDGERLAYARQTCPGPYYPEECELLGLSVVTRSGGSRRDLTSDADRHPSWSPDGSSIVFDRRGAEIYRMSAEGGTALRIPLPPEITFARSPSWSPDGTRLTFACVIDGPSDICVTNLDGAALARLSQDALHQDDPEWSPDGERIAFSNLGSYDFPPNWVIAVINADGTGRTELGPGRDPSWSPDGTRLVYEAPFRAGLRIIGLDGTGPFVLTKRSRDNGPFWNR
jgi:dipeptidyl aminopeptidase/acylaminoacyl peptidase